jgi:hypothetical protein
MMRSELVLRKGFFQECCVLYACWTEMITIGLGHRYWPVQGYTVNLGRVILDHVGNDVEPGLATSKLVQCTRSTSTILGSSPAWKTEQFLHHVHSSAVECP